jgi:hypothetical protein
MEKLITKLWMMEVDKMPSYYLTINLEKAKVKEYNRLYIYSI